MPGMTYSISGNEVRLVPFTLEHLNSGDYIGWLNDPEVTRTLGRVEYLLPVTLESLESYHNSLPDNCTMFAIEAGPDHEFCGTLKLYDLDPWSRRAAIGIMIGKKALWGKQIATKAIATCCSHFHAMLGIRKFWAGYLGCNAGMARAFEKNGFVIEGVLKNHHFLGGSYEDVVYVGLHCDKQGTP